MKVFRVPQDTWVCASCRRQLECREGLDRETMRALVECVSFDCERRGVRLVVLAQAWDLVEAL